MRGLGIWGIGQLGITYKDAGNASASNIPSFQNYAKYKCLHILSHSLNLVWDDDMLEAHKLRNHKIVHKMRLRSNH